MKKIRYKNPYSRFKSAKERDRYVFEEEDYKSSSGYVHYIRSMRKHKDTGRHKGFRPILQRIRTRLGYIFPG